MRSGPTLDPPAVTAIDEIRLRALERLYRRRDAVDALIRSLKDYVDAGGRAECVPITAARKCS